ncbi:polysaccharide lyase family 7 protein [Paenibacillus cremeus]|nr:polysaccharide lyase family 7 protein [Paenibacillus cremeus]
MAALAVTLLLTAGCSASQQPASAKPAATTTPSDKSVAASTPAPAAPTATPAPANPPSSLDRSKPPGSNIDLSHWKLTLPLEKATDISTADLVKGYSSDYFYTDPQDGAMTFWSPVVGGKTANTEYPRSELREMMNPSSSKVNWTWQGTHIENAREMVTQVPSSGRVVVMQIHGITTAGGDAAPLVKVEYDDKKKAIDCLVKSSSKTGDKDIHYTFNGYDLNKAYDGQLKVVDGVLSMTFNGVTKTVNFVEQDPNWKTLNFYFKAGVYVQDNQGDKNEGGRVKIYKLDVSHS